MYAPALSEVVYRPLEVVVGALKKAHIYALCTKKKKKKKEQCHELLVVLGGAGSSNQAGAVCGALKI